MRPRSAHDARVSDQPAALRKRFKRIHDVEALLAAAATTLVLGLVLPILRVEKFIFWESGYSIVTGVAGLFDEREWLLGFVILLFSVVFPIAKLGVLATLWWGHLTHEQRFALLRRLEMIGRWSMLDVFAVAILVVAGKLGAVADVEARVGIYLFAVAILLSMLATWRVKQLALRAAREANVQISPSELASPPRKDKLGAS
jgi:paraquat-inducible protein A